MAKVTLNKLGLKINNEIKSFNFNEQMVEVKQYLPVNDKLELISNVINSSADHNNFANPIKITIFTTLEIIQSYTNITFTEKQKEDPAKLYDLVISTGLANEIIQNIPEIEYNEILNGVKESVEAVYKYRNSILGILETVSQDYSQLDFDATAIQKKLSDPANMELLRDVLTRLG